MPMFADAYDKAHWASDKLNRFESFMQGYEDQGVRSSIVTNPNGTVFRVECDTIPFPIGLAVGDVCRNLRDSLDHFISAIARKHLGTDKRSMFPVAQYRNALNVDKRPVFQHAAYAGVVRAISNTIIPTEEDNFPIWAVSRLNNVDKHRAITTTVVVNATPFPNMKGCAGTFLNNEVILFPGSAQDFPIPNEMSIEGEDHLHKFTAIKFGQSEVTNGQDVIPFLKDAVVAHCDALMVLQNAYKETQGL